MSLPCGVACTSGSLVLWVTPAFKDRYAEKGDHRLLDTEAKLDPGSLALRTNTHPRIAMRIKGKVHVRAAENNMNVLLVRVNSLPLDPRAGGNHVLHVLALE